MKTIELALNGCLYLEFYDLKSDIVADDEKIKILKKLQSGDYVISLVDRLVMDLDNDFRVLYKFEFEIGESMDYYWDLVE